MSGDKSTLGEAKTRKRSSATSERQGAISPARQKSPSSSVERVTTVAELLRAAAASIEGDPGLARSLFDATAAHGQIQSAPQKSPSSAGRRSRTSTQPPDGQPSPTSVFEADRPLDPFTMLRKLGEPGLREQLHLLDLEALRTIVRSHRLDPGRIASRWTDRERLVELIVEQVQARAGLGRAFERV